MARIGRRKNPPLISDELADQLLDLLRNGEDETERFRTGDLFRPLKEALANRMMQTEMTHFLENRDGDEPKTVRNGYGSKNVKTEADALELAIPRDRLGEFSPQLVKKHCRRLPGFDDKVISLYSRGLSTRKIREHIEEIYGVEVSAELVSRITDEVLDEAERWQSRPLDQVYPLVILDAIHVPVREAGKVSRMALYLAIGFNVRGGKEILGMWIGETEGAKFWLGVMQDLKARGVEDILIAVADGLKGFPEAIQAVFPQTEVQTCIVHLIRNSLAQTSRQDRRSLADALKEIYQAASAETALEALRTLEAGDLGEKYPGVPKLWFSQWERVVPFYGFSDDIRRLIYTTNAIESLNSVVRRSVRAHGHFPNRRAAMKLVYLALKKHTEKWLGGRPNCWTQARREFAIRYGERFPMELEGKC